MLRLDRRDSARNERVGDFVPEIPGSERARNTQYRSMGDVVGLPRQPENRIGPRWDTGTDDPRDRGRRWGRCDAGIDLCSIDRLQCADRNLSLNRTIRGYGRCRNGSVGSDVGEKP